MEDITYDNETDEDTSVGQPEDEEFKLSDDSEYMSDEDDKSPVIPHLHYTFDDEYHIRKEINKMKKTLQQTVDIAQTWKREQRNCYNFDLELTQMCRRGSVKVPVYRAKCLELKEKSKELDDSLTQHFSLLREKIYVIASRVNKLQKDSRVLLTQKRICDTEHLKLLNTKESYYLPKTTKTQYRQALHVDCIPYPENRFRTLFSQQLEMKNNLLRDSYRRMEQKDKLIDEKARQYEALKHSMSQLVPAQRLIELSKSKMIIREQSKKILELTTLVALYKQKAEDHKSENEKLIQKFEATKELFLKQKKNSFHKANGMLLKPTSCKCRPLPEANPITIVPQSLPQVLCFNLRDKSAQSPCQPK